MNPLTVIRGGRTKPHRCVCKSHKHYGGKGGCYFVETRRKKANFGKLACPCRWVSP